MYRINKIFAFFLSLSFISYIYAQEHKDKFQEISLYKGDAYVFSTNIPTRIVIGKPEVIDVSLVTNTDITVLATSSGSSSFIYWDKDGQHFYRINVFAENLNTIKQRIDSLLKELNLSQVYTKISDTESKILILGAVQSDHQKKILDAGLAPFKDKIIDLVLLKEKEEVIDIDVQVLELSRDATEKLGFILPDNIKLTEKGSLGISDIGTKWSTLFKLLNFSRDAFSVTLDFLIQEGKAKILSRPRLSCQSGKEAELLVGGEKPIFTTEVVSGGGQGTEVGYKEFGIKLRIRPTVVETDKIKLALNVEVSDAGTAETIGPSTAPTAKAYPLNKRSVSTELFLKDGQILAIGGLIKQKSEEETRRVPFLSNIPLVGLFFRNKVTKTGGGRGSLENTELFITLIPTILKEKPIETKIEEETKESDKPSLPLKSEESGETEERLASSLKQSIGKKPFHPIDAYISFVKNKISEYIYYPKEAQDAGWEGTVILDILVSRDGKIKEVLVKQSCGYKTLDELAMNAVKKASPFPHLPKELKSEELRIEIPIVYHQNN